MHSATLCVYQNRCFTSPKVFRLIFVHFWELIIICAAFKALCFFAVLARYSLSMTCFCSRRAVLVDRCQDGCWSIAVFLLHSLPVMVVQHFSDVLSGKATIGRERSKTMAIDQQPSWHRSTRTALREQKHIIDKLYLANTAKKQSALNAAYYRRSPTRIF